MSKDEAMTILWNMRAGYIKANECGLATKGEYKKEIEALDCVINEYINANNE